MTYSEKLRDPRWQKKRLQIFSRDGFKCISCNDPDTELQVHHLKYQGEPWEAPDEFLITLCRHCHSIIETYECFKFSLTGDSKKFKHGNTVILIIPQDDEVVHFFKIHFNLTDYCFSMAGNILKDFIHHVINWWLKYEREENLNFYKMVV
jgi:hypothetical protein